MVHFESMTLFLSPVQILLGPEHSVSEGCVLIKGRYIKAFGEKARHLAKELGIKAINAKNKIIAPCLVDPHSTLEDPFNSSCQTLVSLKKEAAMAGYGQIAILPKSSSWRDKPEHLFALSNPKDNMIIHLWGSFSIEGKGEELAPHNDLIHSGAIGLAEDDSIPSTELLKKGFTLGEMGNAPILIAPKDKTIQGTGIVRESVEVLRAGCPPDPLASEVLPLSVLIALQNQHPEINMRLMNISTAEGVTMLAKSDKKILTSASWWHLVADSSSINPSEIGLYVTPSLGNYRDREALINGLREGLITAVAVHSIPLDQAETIKPISQRLPGVSGHQLVLPALWEALIVQRKWSVENLWKAISFGPSKMLNQPPERLKEGSNRWVLFNPDKKWIQKIDSKYSISSSNQPWSGREMTGMVEDCGLIQ